MWLLALVPYHVISKRLGEERPGQLGEDPRGDDIGGNFSTIPPEEGNKR